MKIKKSELEKIILEEIDGILNPAIESEKNVAIENFSIFLDNLGISYTVSESRFYIQMPYIDQGVFDKDPEKAQQSTVVVDVMGSQARTSRK